MLILFFCFYFRADRAAIKNPPDLLRRVYDISEFFTPFSSRLRASMMMVMM
jgi:hypothetical protein